LSLAVVVSDATGSWAADDSPTSIHAIRAAVLIPEMVRMSASSFNSGRGLWLSSVNSERGLSRLASCAPA
jgi:hypothetical protein